MSRLSPRGLDPGGAPPGEAIVVGDDGQFTVGPVGGDGAVYREVLMASGVTGPAEALESSAGGDWLYGIPGGS